LETYGTFGKDYPITFTRSSIPNVGTPNVNLQSANVAIIGPVNSSAKTNTNK
jgi:hypothetical protein